MTFKQKCRYILVGVLLLAAFEVGFALLNVNASADQRAACEAAEKAVYIFDTCINLNDCRWGPKDLLESSNYVKFISENCPVKP